MTTQIKAVENFPVLLLKCKFVKFECWYYKCLKVTPDLRGCPWGKNSHAHNFKGNHGKSYLGKRNKCRFGKKYKLPVSSIPGLHVTS